MVDKVNLENEIKIIKKNLSENYENISKILSENAVHKINPILTQDVFRTESISSDNDSYFDGGFQPDELEEYFTKLDDLPEWLSSPTKTKKSKTMYSNDITILNENKNKSANDEVIITNTKIDSDIFNDLNTRMKRINEIPAYHKSDKSVTEAFKKNCTKLVEILDVIEPNLPKQNEKKTEILIPQQIATTTKMFAKALEDMNFIKTESKNLYEFREETGESITTNQLTELFDKLSSNI